MYPGNLSEVLGLVRGFIDFFFVSKAFGLDAEGNKRLSVGE